MLAAHDEKTLLAQRPLAGHRAPRGHGYPIQSGGSSSLTESDPQPFPAFRAFVAIPYSVKDSVVPSRFVAQVVYKDNDSFIVAYMDPEDGRPEEFHEVPGNLEVLPNDPGVSIMPYVGHVESSRKERRRDSKAVARDVRQEYRRRREKLEELARNLGRRLLWKMRWRNVREW